MDILHSWGWTYFIHVANLMTIRQSITIWLPHPPQMPISFGVATGIDCHTASRHVKESYPYPARYFVSIKIRMLGINEDEKLQLNMLEARFFFAAMCMVIGQQASACRLANAASKADDLEAAIAQVGIEVYTAMDYALQ
jgi:hypothetical protein